VNIKNLLAKLPIVWMLCFFMAPLMILAVYSFLQKGIYGGVEWQFQLENFSRIGTPLYLKVFATSFWLAAKTTVICLLFAIPLAFYIILTPKNIRPLMIFFIILPFLSNFLVRTYAAKNLLAYSGLLHPLWAFFEKQNYIGLVEFFQANSTAVQFGMISNYLPLMVIPLYVGFERFDFSLMEAAKDLGANSFEAFFKIFLPNVKAPMISASLMVFIPCLGEFIIPDLLGGAQTQTLGKLISEQFLKTRDWPFGSALAILLIIVLTVTQILETQFKKKSTAP
jgi:spermidine/putrescine transport system permease protein